MSANGLGRMRIIEKGQRVNQYLYLEILKRELQWSDQDLHQYNEVFMEDNTPCYRATTVKQYLNANYHDRWIPDWPGQSPDINTIENSWARIGKVIEARAPTNCTELIRAILHAWYHVIKDNDCQRLVESVPNRLRALIRKRGFPMQY